MTPTSYLRFVATIILMVTFSDMSYAQLEFSRFADIKVTEGNDTLDYPWTGGLNDTHLSDVDIDNDGINDLVLFAKGFLSKDDQNNGSKFLLFKNNGTPDQVDYTYMPEWEEYFPDVLYWAVMEDMNCDSLEDLLSGQPGSIEYREAYRDTSGMIRFRGPATLEFEGQFSLTNIFNPADNIPAFEDINGDGDRDVLVFGSFINGFNLFENYSIETSGNCGDTLFFQEVDNCWGKFVENGNGKGVVFFDTCGTIGPGPIFRSGGPRHAGVSIVMYDEDNDGDKEIIIGDGGFANISRVINWGSPDSAKCRTQDTIFPAYDVSVNLPVSPAPFLVDVNNDGKRDFFVGTNRPGVANNTDNVYYYENVTTNDTIRFAHRQNDFITGEMIDFGEGAHPVFFDYNGDTLMDLLVGNMGYFDSVGYYSGAIAVLENVGNDSLPAYNIVDRDFVDLSGLPTDTALALTIGDLDGDGDEDLMVGDGRGNLHYFTNDPNGVTGIASFTLQDTTYFNITADRFASPYLYDVDGDSVLDILVGTRRGLIEYYRNRGSKANAFFDPIPTNSTFGDIDVSPVQNFTEPGFASPIITPLDSTGELYLLVGTRAGRIFGYKFEPDSANGGRMPLLFNFYSKIDEGERINIAIGELSGDNKLEMIIGNYRGGLSFFTQSDLVEPIDTSDPVDVIEVVSSLLEITLYPNPANDVVALTWQSQEQLGDLQFKVFDLMGRETSITATIRQSGMSGNLSFDVSSLSTGVYYLTLYNDQLQQSVKLLVQ